MVLAKEIIEKVGGASNITGFVPFMTRLRFNLKDIAKVDLEPIKNVDGVAGAVNKGGVYLSVTGNIGTKQAIGLVSEDGVEILIHVGIDLQRGNMKQNAVKGETRCFSCK